MKSSKTVRILTLAAAAAMMLASCAAPAAPAAAPAAPAATTAPAAEAAKPTEAPAAGAETMRFYSSLPLTGNSAAQTATIVKAIELAIAQNTKDGTVCEGKFKIDMYRSTMRPPPKASGTRRKNRPMPTKRWVIQTLWSTLAPSTLVPPRFRFRS